LNIELKLPSGIFPFIPDLSLKYVAIWKIQPLFECYSKKNAQTESTNIRLSTDFKTNRLLRIIHLFEHLERKNKMDYSHQKSFLQVQIMR
jgi:hypothetical protein